MQLYFIAHCIRVLPAYQSIINRSWNKINTLNPGLNSWVWAGGCQFFVSPVGLLLNALWLSAVLVHVICKCVGQWGFIWDSLASLMTAGSPSEQQLRRKETCRAWGGSLTTNNRDLHHTGSLTCAITLQSSSAALGRVGDKWMHNVMQLECRKQ